MNIKKDKILSLDKYIEEALYNFESGYYMKNNPFGKDGDFITAPNISILFSEMIAIWIISFWEHLKCPKQFNLIELGAGNGEMMVQLIKTFNKFPLFKKSCKINILEISNSLKKIQKNKLKKKKVTWLGNLKEISNKPCIFIANEFFDALPVKQFLKKDNKWYEKKILMPQSGINKFKNIILDIKKIEKKIGFQISQKQKFIEYSPLSIGYLKQMAKKITSNGGGILIIDYGNWDLKMKNSLKSIYNHKFNNVLKNFGKADITYDINFRLLEIILKKYNLKISGRSNQKDFLLKLGIMDRAEIISKNLPFSSKADIFYRVQRLIGKNDMGKIFKVMVATNKNLDFKVGF